VLDRRQDRSFGDVRDRIVGAKAVTPQLMSDLLAACGIDDRDPTVGADRVRRLVTARAWTDAALKLIDHKLLRWKIARLIFEEGEWHCLLSKYCQVPDWLDDAIEIKHEVLPLAILAAFISARGAELDSVEDARRTVPHIKARENSEEPQVYREDFAQPS
jgi:hypothetical protein